jgi:hypothetical protein
LEFWLPKSQVSEAGKYEQGDTDCTISITQWLADKLGVE